MSSLWTPGGERPVPRADEPARSQPPHTTGSPGFDPTGGVAGPSGASEPSEAEMRAQMEELRDRLAQTPAEVVIANHAYGLFELAALHISLDPPQLDQARLAIDALGYLVEGLGGRLGEPIEDLTSALGQLRMAYVQIQAARSGGPGPGGPGGAEDGRPGEGTG